jgi:hypothetical protein
MNSKAENQGAHVRTQPRAEKNASILLALQMEQGCIEALEFPISKLPTEPLQDIAIKIHKSLGNGRRGWAEVFEDVRDNRILEITQELDTEIDKGNKPNIHTLKKELEAFHITKSRQLLLWNIQAALDKGENVSELVEKLSKIEAPSDKAFLARVYAMAFNADEIPPQDEACMSIGDIPIAARGNLTAIQGKSKVGKSAVVAAILGAAQRGEYTSQADCLCIEWKGEATGAIIHLDTEQSRADWHGLVSRSVLRSGNLVVSERLVSLPLVIFARSERLEILGGCLEKEQAEKGKIDAVIIDGIADLCISPNDEAEALELISQIHALSQKYNCPIYCILHENPSSKEAKTRGHLGSELNRKAFANIRIDKDGEGISTIYGTDMRKRDLPKEQGFCFGWDDKAGMHTFRGRAARLKAAQLEEKATRKAREFWEPIFEHAERENIAFPAMTPKQAVEIEKEISGNEKETLPDTMKKRMQKAETLGVLRKIGTYTWGINQSGTSGKHREKENSSR